MRIKYIYGDEIGYVALVDKMGDQFTPAGDARISTGKGNVNPEKDAQLQDRLMKDGHSSPFESVLVKFELCVPIFVLREIDRHRTLKKSADVDLDETPTATPEESSRSFFARNEMSGRYIKLPNVYYHPRCIRAQSNSNKQQGVGGVEEEVGREFLERGRELTEKAREFYDWACQNGIEKGLARIYNTYNNYVKIRMTGSLKNWLDFLKLRLPADVLFECRAAAEAVGAFIEEEFPEIWKSWRENVYEGVMLTKEEKKFLQEWVVGGVEDFFTTNEFVTRILKKLGR